MHTYGASRSANNGANIYIYIYIYIYILITGVQGPPRGRALRYILHYLDTSCTVQVQYLLILFNDTTYLHYLHHLKYMIFALCALLKYTICTVEILLALFAILRYTICTIYAIEKHYLHHLHCRFTRLTLSSHLICTICII